MSQGTLMVASGALLCTASIATLGAQANAPRLDERLDAGHSKLKITLTLDRSEYFPGEIVELTISVENPTSEALEILAPFNNRTGVVSLLEKGNRRVGPIDSQGYGPVTFEEFGIEVGDAPAVPTMVIQPHQVVVKKLHSYDSNLGSSRKVLLGGAAPNRAGDFRLLYWAKEVDFRVVMPVFEGMIQIDWPEWEDRPAASEYKVVRVQKQLLAFVVFSEGKHFLCLDKEPFAGRVDPPPVDSEGRLLNDEFHLNRYARVAESSAPITSLKGKADALGRVQLSWGPADEKTLVIERDELVFDSRRLGR